MEFSRSQVWMAGIVVVLVVAMAWSLRKPRSVHPPIASGVHEAFAANWSRPSEMTPEVADRIQVLLNHVPLGPKVVTLPLGQPVTVHVDLRLLPGTLRPKELISSVVIACQPLEDLTEDWSLGKQAEWNIGPGESRPGKLRYEVGRLDLKNSEILSLAGRVKPGIYAVRIYALLQDPTDSSLTHQTERYVYLASGELNIVDMVNVTAAQ